MNKEDLKIYLKSYADEFLEKSPYGNYYCPCCETGPGCHKSSAGALSVIPYKPTKFKCFKCEASGDIFTLIKMNEGIEKFGGQVVRACEFAGIDPKEMGYDNQAIMPENSAHKKPIPAVDKNPYRPPPTDYTSYFTACEKHIDRCGYLDRRGISKATQKKYHIGYDPAWSTAKSSYKTPRVIIPTSRYSYLARDVRPQLTDRQKQYSKIKQGPVHIFNEECMRNSKEPVFVVEGEIDALSILELGYKAVAVGSVSYVRLFLDAVKRQEPEGKLLIAMDNDQYGVRAAKKIMDGLEKLGKAGVLVNITGGYKDPNEYLVADRTGFKSVLFKAAEQYEQNADRKISNYKRGNQHGRKQHY